jgi:hypothetical protein
MSDNINDGWGWFEAAENIAPRAAGMLTNGDALPALAARCFKGDDGRRLLAYLRKITLERGLAPGVSEALIRHLEGQRQLVRYIEALVAEGTGHPDQFPHKHS